MSYGIMGFLKEKDISYSEHARLDNLSHIRAGGTARILAEPQSTILLCELCTYLANKKIAYKIIGRMSNTMSGLGEFDGVVIKTDKLSRKTVAENCITAECGTRLSELIWNMARLGYGGAEELFMIPASVGGAIYNNAGAHGKAISDIISLCDVYFPEKEKTVTLLREQMSFGYRNSLLKSSDAVLLSARLEFIPKSFSEIKSEIEKYAKIRRASQPLQYASLGSTFKQYDGVSAGYYIDKAGLKGLRVGNAMVSDKHAGFIVNLGGADAEDIMGLIAEVKKRVFDAFGITLEEEIEII